MHTYGWDVVFAYPMDQINDQLGAQANASMGQISYIDPETQAKLTATFAPWQIVPGGTAKLLLLSTPFTSGTLTIQGMPPVDLSGVSPVLQLSLGFFASSKQQQTSDLCFDVQSVAPPDNPPKAGQVACIHADTSEVLGSNLLARAILRQLLPAAVVAARQRLSFVFASVLSQAQPSARWLLLQSYDYAYIQPEQSKVGYLAVMGVVTQRDVSQLPRAVDPTLLTPGYDVYYALSGSMFMQNILLPQMPTAYGQGTTTANFCMSGPNVINKGQLPCPPAHWGADTYHPHLDSLTVSLSDDILQTSGSGSFDITGLAGASVTFETSANSHLVFDPSSGNASLQPLGSASVNYQKHIPWYDWLAAVIGGGIVIAVVDGVINSVTSAVASSVAESLNTESGLGVATAASVVVKWPGARQVVVQNAGLAGSLYMRCKSAS